MLVTAFVLGFTGSLHCIGMCGPLAIQVQGRAWKGLLLNRMLYNTGRVLTYGLLGLVAGMIGRLTQISGWQGWFSIILGIMVLLFLLFSRVEKWVIPGTVLVLSTLKRGISKFMHQRSAGAALLMGVLNGFLPCGLVYAAVVLALVQTSWVNSFAVMMVFGLGTVPAMLLAAWLYEKLHRLLPLPVRKIQLVFVGLMAFILIWRGVSIEGLFSIDQTVLCYPLH
jgi:sulfite exporter TauE/SafE